MSDVKPSNPPCGATHLAKTKKGSWVWLFEEPVNSTDYESVEELTVGDVS